jgi:hypothetical protein
MKLCALISILASDTLRRIQYHDGVLWVRASSGEIFPSVALTLLVGVARLGLRGGQSRGPCMST